MSNNSFAEPFPTPLVRALEVWIPNEDQSQLRFQHGFYRGTDATASNTLPVTVARGQGLAGQVLARSAPVILQDLTAYRGFVRAEIAAQSGFTAGVGWPMLHQQAVAAVVTLLFATPDEAAGAFEIWQPSADGRCMEWADGYYGDLFTFEAVSRRTAFILGRGLPGHVLASQLPILFENLSSERGFIRARVAAQAGLHAGLGIPVLNGTQVQQVVLLLTSPETPIARVMEIWRPNRRRVLSLETGYYGPLHDFAAISRATTFEPGIGLPGRVYAEKAPVVFERLTRDAGFIRYEAASRAGLEAALGFPILHGNAVRAVVVLFN